MRANCVRRLALCFLVMAMLSLGGASSEYAYSNGHKNPEEVPDQWAPHVSQKINLAVRGASGHDYKWLSSDTRILVVSFYGVIQAKRPGIATLKAVSTFDSHNFDEVMIVSVCQHVCFHMDDMEPKLDNDQLAPNHTTIACMNMIFLINPKLKACLDMSVLVNSIAGGILGVLCYYCFCRIGNVMPNNHRSKKQFKRPSMRRIRNRRRL
ncbi:predicted protein [Arabidopsis lyrata subsp. lyrata]|uniref:Predicted protein n=1 Tax=Arabidopsis lyrata subsp. lyrata TaxID=81972 RepID=D7MHZ4_ARALL|nr:uncharacterized protein LOC9304529 isoform X1 [Arabidopsis lyrata subsp. lyrata]XP_020872476.1 uncharacterized protein LOC9304529 isoform X1 [Arabidopsis lyrata subsp. lyrata]EFH46724.1 predicted protein [Arabidopsis lyrata subsp. lyrata]|eukprot:XP_002870465.1 uncharacterized protein LOC9304529 isoform X1 [Arabidopsis lyrata subsp. lyrata]